MAAAKVLITLIPPLLLLTTVSADPQARQVKWSKTAIGPDGPWNAVSVAVGTGEQPVALFPGRAWETVVITSDYCAFNSSINHCEAGTYSKDKAIADDLAGITYSPGVQSFEAGVVMVGPKPKMFLDQFDFSLSSDADQSGVIPNVSMSLLESQFAMTPAGFQNPLFAGCLSVGAEANEQTYVGIDTTVAKAATNAKGQIIPWYLKQENQTSSASFGMHIGSAAANSNISGSLIYGGYDRSRVLGDILSFMGTMEDSITLTDIGIKSFGGNSPFPFDNKTGLLAQNNNSITGGIDVAVDGCSPYLTLPKSACDNIANAGLPLQYNASLGLYLWDTSDSNYKRIVRSASALTFSIQGGSSQVAINVPFQHLNLTLDVPYTNEATAYFPCSTGGTGKYVLGRAFLQDAFIGANWEKKRWWLAQAPGPGAATESNVVNILPDDLSVINLGHDWEASWEDTWKALQAESDGEATNNKTDGGSGHSTESLSVNTKVGIGVGSVFGGALLGVGAFFLWRYIRSHRRNRRARMTAEVAATESQKPQPGPYSAGFDQRSTLGTAGDPAEVVGSPPPFKENQGGFSKPELPGNDVLHPSPVHLNQEPQELP